MAMFESLSKRLEGIFNNLSGQGKLTEEDVNAALREVRIALIEADVNLKVARQFVERVKEKAIGADVLGSLSPAQQVLSIVNDELIEVLGGTEGKNKLELSGNPPVIMLVGLQGSGKTTTAAKLGRYLRDKQGMRPLLVAADMYRPAAVNQLKALGKQLQLPVYWEQMGADPVDICVNALEHAREQACNVIILDTAGRLNIDERMMEEVRTIRSRVQPHEVLLVADAMTGQEAVRVAKDFNEAVSLTGMILTKMDGDARGGAALSIRAVTGLPVKFMGVGEKTDALVPFHPDRLASRILGMGDVLSLIEQAQEAIDEEEALKAQEKLKAGKFDLEDFLTAMRQLKRMGPLRSVMEMLPGFNKLLQMPEMEEALESDQLKYVEAMILSMTKEERRNPDIINGSRRKRIAAGSGTKVEELNALLKQFNEMRSVFRQISTGKGPFAQLMRQYGKGGGGFPGLGGGFPGLGDGNMGEMPALPKPRGKKTGKAARKEKRKKQKARGRR
ncbi:signal recognition particle subunit FFH/SRP54 (srp54) [Thermosporothrix hazakensis]|jgi:signal recognition particle subunit SRP54|uniref:Signal recognition particle protein n=2 Tax=Thermosporothrix hazakensis TaxID=644383 RepID=A0A326TSH3_THEHA|nr:signal recognition particle protein [Thermosporothrix hazakensis]PZW19340.1 signal recognition particle subunit FFH/SRP54 (srp54) [Thermosporothrix hazakensis]GCE48222.1 signal recognition particle protein [Thermosporothrix hazakensis]